MPELLNCKKIGDEYHIQYLVHPTFSRIHSLVFNSKTNELYEKEYIHEKYADFLILPHKPNPLKYKLYKIIDNKFKNTVISLIKN